MGTIATYCGGSSAEFNAAAKSYFIATFVTHSITFLLTLSSLGTKRLKLCLPSIASFHFGLEKSSPHRPISASMICLFIAGLSEEHAEMSINIGAPTIKPKDLGEIIAALRRRSDRLLIAIVWLAFPMSAIGSFPDISAAASEGPLTADSCQRRAFVGQK